MCLSSQIGIRDRCIDNSTPAYYINDLPGISNAFLSKVTTQEDQSFFDLFDKQVTFAENELKSIIRTQLKPKFKAKSVLRQGNVAKFKDLNQATLSSGTNPFDGFRIQLAKSEYLKLFIHKVWIHTGNTDTVNISLFDLDQGKELQTTTLTGVTDEIVEKEVNWSISNDYNFKDLFIGHDNSTYYKSYISWCKTCSSRFLTYKEGLRFSARSIQGNKVESNLRMLTHGSMNFSYSLVCDMDAFICQSRDLWALSMLYLVGKKIIETARYENTRFNHLITLESDLDSLMEMYEEKFRLNISEGLQNIKIPKDICFECSNPTKIMVNLP